MGGFYPKQEDNNEEMTQAQNIDNASHDGLTSDKDVNVFSSFGRQILKYKWVFVVILVLITIPLLIMSSKKNYVKSAESVMYIEAYDVYGNRLWSGSGFLVNNSKTIVTNYHVICSNDLVPYQIIVYAPDNSFSTNVKSIINYSEENDLAIVECDDFFQMSPLKISKSSSVKQGDTIYAIGYPQGLGNTISDGLVSAIYKEDGFDCIQISAPISHGSSGGPVVSKNGRVVGVVCASVSDSQNLNLAISSDCLQSLMNDTPQNIDLLDLTFAESNVERYVASHFKCKKGSSSVYIYGYLTKKIKYTTTVYSKNSLPDLPSLMFNGIPKTYYYLQPDNGVEPKIEVFFNYDYNHDADGYVRLRGSIGVDAYGNPIIEDVISLKRID